MSFYLYLSLCFNKPLYISFSLSLCLSIYTSLFFYLSIFFVYLCFYMSLYISFFLSVSLFLSSPACLSMEIKLTQLHSWLQNQMVYFTLFEFRESTKIFFCVVRVQLDVNQWIQLNTYIINVRYFVAKIINQWSI